MTGDDIFDAVADQRRRIADVLDGLTATELDTPSLCAGWSIKTVGAHVLSVFANSFPVFMTAAIRHASMARAIDDLARRRADLPIHEITDDLRRRADHRLSPPLFGPRDPLADILVHSGDMFLPLEIPFDPDPQLVGLALDFLTGPWPFSFVPLGHLRGLSLTAVDSGRTWRTGTEVTGTSRALLMTVTGRDVLGAELGGPGLSELRRRSGW